MNVYHIRSWPGHAWQTGNRWLTFTFHWPVIQLGWVWFDVRHWIQIILKEIK